MFFKEQYLWNVIIGYFVRWFTYDSVIEFFPFVSLSTDGIVDLFVVYNRGGINICLISTCISHLSFVFTSFMLLLRQIFISITLGNKAASLTIGWLEEIIKFTIFILSFIQRIVQLHFLHSFATMSVQATSQIFYLIFQLYITNTLLWIPFQHFG